MDIRETSRAAIKSGRRAHLMTINPDSSAPSLHDVAQRYIGPSTAFRRCQTPALVIWSTPTKVRGVGPWGTTLG